MIAEGHVHNGLIVVDRGGPLPDGARVRIQVESVNGKSPIPDTLQAWVGQGVDLPDDLAINHDHYLHGQPKR